MKYKNACFVLFLEVDLRLKYIKDFIIWIFECIIKMFFYVKIIY